jgi:hypothetical protein
MAGESDWHGIEGKWSLREAALGSTAPIRRVGGRQGWKLPSFDQLASLFDSASAPRANDPQNACLPKKHPFVDIQAERYWTATENAADSDKAWKVSFQEKVFGPEFNVVAEAKDDPAFVWCVRGGQSGPLAY